MSRLSRLAAVGALTLGTSVMSVAPSFAKDVKIGVLMPRTGRYAETGLSVVRGIEMVVKNTNDAGGIKSLGGGKINLVIADNGSDPTKTSLEARRLIAYSDLDITRIGYELGFKDQAYFSRFFTRTQGMTPSAFRAFHGQAAAETPSASD